MNRHLLSVILCTGFATSSYAQCVKLGVKAGLNSSTLTTFVSALDTDKISRKQGLHLGATANLAFSRYFSVQSELLFAEQGAKAASDSKFTYNLNYLNLPVLGRFTVKGFFLESGPQLNFLLAAHNKHNEYSRDIRAGMKPVTLGYAAGLGYGFSNGIQLGARYHADITKPFNYYVSEDASLNGRAPRNSTFQLYAGYVLPCF